MASNKWGKLAMMSGLLGLLALGVMIIGCGGSGGGSSSGSSAPAASTSSFALVGSLNNNDYNDVKAWLGKYTTANNTSQAERTETLQYDTKAFDVAIDIARDNVGNSYIIGQRSSYNQNVIAKYDASGTLVWERVVTAKPMKITIKNNDFYVGGIISTEASADNIWVAKYDLDGTLQWALTRDGAADESMDHFINWAVDVTGTVYVLGNIVNASNFEIWLGKTITGTYWNWDLAKSSVGNAEAATLLLGQSGDVCLVGNLFDVSYNSHIWLGKTITGTYWNWDLTRDASAGLDASASALAADGANNIYVLGSVGSGLATDIWLGKTITGTYWNWDITKNGPSDGYNNPDALVVSGTNVCVLGDIYNGTFNEIWLGKTITGTYWNWDITKTGTANLYCSGYKLVIDKTNSVYVLGMVGDGDDDIWVGKTITGTYWNWDLTKNNVGQDTPTDFYIDNNGTAYVLGQLSNGSREGIWLGKTSNGTSWDSTLLKNGTAASGMDNPSSLLISGTDIFVLGSVTNMGGNLYTDQDIWLGKTTTDLASWDWEASSRGVLTSNILSKTDSQGNIYLATTIMLFEPVSQYAFWLAKFDKDLVLQWALTKTESSHVLNTMNLRDLMVDNAGNAYILGDRMSDAAHQEIWLGKTITGTYWNWDLFNDNNGNDAYAWALAMDNAGQAYVLGTANNGTDNDIWLGKTITGTWTISLTYNSGLGQDDVPKAMTIDNAGNVYVLGTTNNGSNYDIWLGKTITCTQWNRSLIYDSTYTDMPIAMNVNAAGAVYVLGNSWNGSLSNSDIWLGKTITGTYWNWNMTSDITHDYDYALGLLVDQAGSAYVAGQVNSGGLGNYDDDIWLGKTSNGLTWDWSVTKTGTAWQSNDYPVSWYMDSANSIYILGSIVQTPTHGSRNIWLGHYVNGVLQSEIIKDGADKLDDKAVNFAFDTDNHIYIYGNLLSLYSGYNIWLGKYNSMNNPTPVWEIIKAGTQNATFYNLLPLKSTWKIGQLCDKVQ